MGEEEREQSGGQEGVGRGLGVVGFDIDAWLAALPERPPIPAVNDATFPNPDDLLARVIEHYLGSHEFNGLPVGESTGPYQNAEGLLREGLVQLVTTTDYMNTHIRPWVKDDRDRQVSELAAVSRGELMGCLYPTPAAMEAHGPTVTHSEPYRDRMTLGHGTLELVFFELAAVEGYVNEPAFSFTFSDDGFRFTTATDFDHTDDDLLAFEAGYAYDHTVDYQGDEPIRRYWCAFLHDLVKLPARHQLRLSTFERAPDDLFPHPDWWDREIGGRWLDVIGPFTKILWELKAINDVWSIAFQASLFGTVDRPRAWGWVLRPTTGAWNEFIHLTDKLLSDNLRHEGLDAAGAPKTDGDGNQLGTLTRLQALLVSVSRKATTESVRFVLEPLREVRKQRQGPAHKIADTVTDANVVNKQRDLLRDVAESLQAIRSFAQTHPKVRAADWNPPQYIDNSRWL